MKSADVPKKLFLLDAYALIFRAYYAFIKNPRINSKGLNISAMFGFTNVLLDILKKEKPSHMAVVFDPHEETIRVADFPDYKANRDETPEDIKLAFPYIIRIIEAFNIPVYQISKYEADDVIGTLAKKAEQAGFTTYMMTSDKDYGQLVSENIFIYRPGRGGAEADILGVPEVCEKFGVERVEQVIDLLGMRNLAGEKNVVAKLNNSGRSPKIVLGPLNFDTPKITYLPPLISALNPYFIFLPPATLSNTKSIFLCNPKSRIFS